MSLKVFKEALTLAWPLAKRDVMARYRGSVVGLSWALVAPLAMVLVYTLVFQGVFQARWGNGVAAVDGMGFVLRLFAGLIVFQSVAEAATRATRLIQDNANLVKRVVFPLHLLVVALLLQVGVHALLQAAVLGLLVATAGSGVRLSWLALPMAAMWLLLLQYALALGLAAVGAYLRDLQHAVPLVMSGLLFLSPVFYPSDAAPPVLRALLAFNPVSTPIELTRAALFGDAMDWAVVFWQGTTLLLVLLAAHWTFNRLRPGFPDLV